MDRNVLMHLFATCARGLESILAEELHAIGAQDIDPGRGGVSFTGNMDVLYRANLYLRTAVRVLRRIMEAPVCSPDELYEVVKGIDWREYMTPEHTLAVDCNLRDSQITHSLYAALRTKDAICDQFIEKCGRRPSVDTDTPMVGLNLHIYRNQATLSLDSSGESLHKRGYRPILTKAPLNEALAAAIVLRSGWNPETPLIDPMCGSGSIPIEACWIATNRPPGLTRKRFGFMGWMDFDFARWTAVRDEARASIRKTIDASILGFDIHRGAIEMARTNARSAGVGHLLTFERKDVAEFAPPAGQRGTVVCNPPYGERIGEVRELRTLYRTLGEVFAERCRGWRCWVFTGNIDLAREIKLPVREEVRLWNGKIPCRLLGYRPA